MSSTLDLSYSTLEQLPKIAERLTEFAGDRKLFLLNGAMGTGKTTLIKAICKYLGSNDNFSSPTFSIVNEYRCGTGKIFHFDLYRIKNLEELLDIGLEEYLTSGSYCFFEWPELLSGFVSSEHVRLDIEVKENIHYLHGIKF